MRSISAFSTVVAAAVLMLGLAACDKEDNSAKATSTTARATTTHPTTTYAAATPTTEPPTTVTTKGDAACPTAIAVTNAYAVQSDLWDVGFVIPITVGTTTWDCQEHIGTPDLYQECVNRDNPTEKARLGS